jgi:uncharacterized delta-60 repeat protein
MKVILTAFALVLALAVATGLAAAGPGQLDPSFGSGGLATSAIAPGAGPDFENGLAVQQDAKVVVGGGSDMGEGQGGWNFRLLRYTKHGALDPTFGQGGVVLTSIGDVAGDDSFTGDYLWWLALQPDGKIVASGHANDGEGQGGINFALARYTPDGTLDSSFSGDGKLTTAVAPGDNTDRANAALLQPDGKMVTVGAAEMDDTTIDFALARYQPDGTLDTSFGDSGIVTTGVPGQARELIEAALQPDGKIVAAGQACSAPSALTCDFVVARFLADGALDESFGDHGVVVTPVVAGFFDTAWAMALQPDGKIVAAGQACTGRSGRTCDFGLARYNPDGSLDGSFGGDGTVMVPIRPGSFRDAAYTVVLDSTGRIVVGGQSGPSGAISDFALARLNPDGSLDGSFGAGGIIVTPTSQPADAYDSIYDVALDKTGKIVAAGECDRPDTGTDVCVARYKGGDTD